MKNSTKYKILFSLDILLIVMWPIWLITAFTAATWVVFLAGAIWMTDVYDAVRHWRKIHYYTKMGD